MTSYGSYCWGQPGCWEPLSFFWSDFFWLFDFFPFDFLLVFANVSWINLTIGLRLFFFSLPIVNTRIKRRLWTWTLHCLCMVATPLLPITTMASATASVCKTTNVNLTKQSHHRGNLKITWFFHLNRNLVMASDQVTQVRGEVSASSAKLKKLDNQKWKLETKRHLHADKRICTHTAINF